MTTHIYKIDLAQELSSRLGMAVAQGTDDRICQRLNEILGEWSLEGLRGRLVVQTNPDKIETYLLDGHPFIDSAPPEFDMTSSTVSATRRFWSIRHPLESA